MRCSWKKHCAVLQRLYQTKIRNIFGTNKIYRVLDVFVSEGQGLLCFTIEVSSPLHDTARIRRSRGVMQWARRSSEFAEDIEGADTEFVEGGDSSTPSPKTQMCASGDRLRLILKSHRHHHPCTEKTHRNRVKFTLVKDVGTELAIAKETLTSQTNFQKFTRTLRSEPHYRSQHIDPKFTAQQCMEQF